MNWLNDAVKRIAARKWIMFWFFLSYLRMLFQLYRLYSFECRWKGKRIFLLATASRPTLGPTQSPTQWLPGVKRSGREADHSPPSSAEVEVKNAWSYTSTPPIAFMAWCLVKHRNNFPFTSHNEMGRWAWIVELLQTSKQTAVVYLLILSWDSFEEGEGSYERCKSGWGGG